MSASFFVVVSKLRISYGIFLQDITGYSDAEKCRIVLERHNWDIEVRPVKGYFHFCESSSRVFLCYGTALFMKILNQRNSGLA